MNYDNPFALRVSERIVSDTIFLDLLSEVPLMTLKQWAENNCLWNQVTYIQSPPGCGKSTLLRMFTPQVLKSISSNRHKEFKKLVEQLGVKSDNDIKKCAVYLLLGRDYTYIEDNAYAEIKQKGLFFALLNARLICAVIKTLMTLTGTVYKDLESIIYNPKEYILEFKDLEFPCNLQTLLNWAYKREETICNFLDNYMTGDGDLPCDSSLFALHAMNPKWIVKKGIQVVDEFIFELDDAHKLTHRQKEFLRQEVVEKRIDSTLWIAERFESLSHADLCKKTDLLGRDYNIFRLNEDNVNAQKRMLEAIAEKRSKMSRKEISLIDSLDFDLKDDECESIYKEASSRYYNQINKHCNIQLYLKWMEWIARLDTWKEKAEYYYSFLIYYHRGINKFPEINLFPYSEDSITSCLDPIRKDADVLVKIDMNIPYFFGHSKLLELSLGNVDQFLDFSEKLFQALLSKRVIEDMNVRLTPVEQEQIIIKAANNKFDSIEHFPHGSILKNFIYEFVKFCKEQTFTDTFSYRFVSGFAISRLGYNENNDWYERLENKDLAEVIRLCIAYNLIEVTTVTQSVQSQKWTVFYLSRWLCATFKLPLPKGGWRKLSISQLKRWMKNTRIK